MERYGARRTARVLQTCPEDCSPNPWIRDPMIRMYPKTFHYHFENRPILYGRYDTWLCFEVKRNDSPVSCGVFRNQEPPKTPCHAEDCFLTWFHDMLSSDQDYQVTWYTSWSPCPVCADDVAGLLAGHGNVTLTICCARLYYYQDPDYQKGLRRMNRNGARLHIMSQEEFKHCWETFVDNQGEPFQPWDGLKEYHQLWNAQLEEIL
uniref:single-stranded DNA cytosine deaminase n=1 Tax=Microcebus murinus TaxID=30608 RepID=A0A8C6EI65_MICMU